MSETQSPLLGQRARSYLGYGGLLGVVVIAYLVIRAYGDTLIAPAPLHPTGPDSFPQIHVNDFVHVLLALVFVIAAARTLGLLFRFIHQPPVVGEMIAGILLGPSLLGHVAPHFAAYILPQSIAPLLNVIAQVGVILYMFLVGLELDISGLRGRAHSTIAISHASIVAPFLLGAVLALALYPHLATRDVSFTAFSLFLGISMSVTAFPVLARILSDRGINKTRLGTLTLACAAIDDVSAWCLLAFVVSVTQAHAGSALPTLLLAFGYIAAMLLIARPLIVRITTFIDSKGSLSQGSLAFVLLAILLSSLATESIGIHSIFGAFVLGAIIPHRSSLARDIAGKLEDFVIVFLLPAFFAFTGLRTQIGLVSGARQWMFFGLIILVASAGKFGGSALAARFSGLNWRDASALGILMNTRGLMELIVLNIGLELHVISPALFAMLVLMALTTTFITTPILHFVAPRAELDEEFAPLAKAASNVRAGTLVPVSNPNTLPNLVDVALSLTAEEGPPPLVLSLVRGSAASLRSGFRGARELPPSRSPLLSAALDTAWARGKSITPRAIWTTDPARDIVLAAERAQVRWLVLESRRSLFHRYPKTSVVNKVLELAAPLALQVAVIPQSEEPPAAGPVTCLFEAGKDGNAAFELAAEIAQARGQNPRVILLSEDDEQMAAIQVAWGRINSVEGPSLAVSVMKSDLEIIGDLVIGHDLLERFQKTNIGQKENLIIVQGAGESVNGLAEAPLRLQPVSV